MNEHPLLDRSDYLPADDDSWKVAVAEASIELLLSDPTISTRNREIFRHVVLQHETPEQVATAFGLTRNNIDQIKKRLMTRLQELVTSMSADFTKG